MKRNITTSGPPLLPTINATIHDGVGNRPKVSMSDSVFISSSSHDFFDFEIDIEPCEQSESAPRHALD